MAVTDHVQCMLHLLIPQVAMSAMLAADQAATQRPGHDSLQGNLTGFAWLLQRDLKQVNIISIVWVGTR